MFQEQSFGQKVIGGPAARLFFLFASFDRLRVEAFIFLDVRGKLVFQRGLKPCGQHSPRPTG